MHKVISATNLTRGDLIAVRVKARNIDGWVAYSQQNIYGALIETEPDAPVLISYNPLTSKNNKIDIFWTLIETSYNGGSPVLGYQISVKIDNTWSNITVNSPTTTNYTISGLYGGIAYQFVVAGYNKYGVGKSTQILNVIAGQQPSTVDPPTVTTAQAYVTITWTKPFENYSNITGYKVYIQDGSHLFTDATLDCNS